MFLENITIGADPELFIINEKTKAVVSSIGKIPGKKGDPWVGEDMPKGFGLETDNIVAEFNIPPVTNIGAFINNIEYMKDYINKFVKNIDPNLGILCAASRIVNKSELNSPEAKLFGCEPDYNVYTEAQNPKPEGAATNLRSCGFHIHVGYQDHNIDTSLQLIKYMDMYIGVPSVVRDKDRKRRSLYGKAGCFRLTPYGVEYRVLSSAMMKDTETLAFVWKQLDKAISAFNCEGRLISSATVVDCINTSNIKKAEELILRYSLID